MLVATFTPQAIAIAVVLVLLYFNRRKLPRMARDLGKSLRQTKKSFEAHHERQDAKANEIEATVVSEEDVTRARQQARERDEV